jgi:hypothetical protein
MARLANYLGARGSYASAVERLQRALDSQERSLGPEHPVSLITWNNLARCTGLAADAAGARDKPPRCCPWRSGSWAPSTRTP